MHGNGAPSDQDRALPVDLFQRLVAILSDILQIDLDPSVQDIARKEIEAWDSINHLRLVLELEDVFQISLSDDESAALMSLREVEALLLRHGIQGSPAMDTRDSASP